MPAADMQPAGDGGEEASFCCEAVMATAATPGDTFAFHADADPATLPSGTPWAAAYGRYVNRDMAKPWLVTAVLCLNPAWGGPPWGGDLRVVDESAVGGVLLCPAPGRLVLMDQDALHCVTPPTAAAPAPRYSLVWKLAVCARGGAGEGGQQQQQSGGGGGGGGGGGQHTRPSSFSLGACLAAAGLEVAPPADLGGAAALAVAVRRAGKEGAGVKK